MLNLEETRALFAGDHFAMAQGITIDRLEDTLAVCSLTLDETHKNAMGAPQGGLVFTLADFTFAVAANSRAKGTVTLSADIHYLRPAAGGRLAATATLRSAGKSICVYQVAVKDDAGTEVALMTATGKLPKATE